MGDREITGFCLWFTQNTLAVSPFELGAQDVVIGAVGEANQAGPMRGCADHNRVALIHDKSNLSIEYGLDSILAGEGDLKGDVTWDEKRAVGQGVRANGSQEQGF